MFFLFLFLLAENVQMQPLNFSFEHANISLQVVATGPIANPYSQPDACGKMIATHNMLHHINTGQTYEGFLSGQLNGSIIDVPAVISSPEYLVDMGVDPVKKVVVFLASGAINVQVYAYNPGASTINHYGFFTTASPPTGVAINGTSVYVITQVIGTNSRTKIEVLDFSGSTLQLPTSLLGLYRHSITPDFSLGFFWTSTTTLKVVNMSNLSTVYDWSPPNSVTADITSKITFSPDSTLAIIQTDNINPIQIMELTNFQIVKTIQIDDTIKEAHFLNSSNEVIVVFGILNTYVVDLLYNRIFSIPQNYIPSIAADLNNSFYMCLYSVVNQYRLTFTRNQVAVEVGPFYYSIEDNMEDSTFFVVVKDMLDYSSKATVVMTNVATSMPFTIYFLGFVNYFAMSSLYVLLNFPLPEVLFRYLSFSYEQVNQNVLNLFGFKMAEMRPLSDERVTRKKGLFFGVSSDFVPSNLSAFIFMGVNIGFILTLEFLTSCLRKNNFLRKLVRSEKWEIIYGQLINVMGPLILPWTFVMVDMGVRDFKNKLNVVGNFVIFFFGLVFPIYYFFELLQERESMLISDRKKQRKEIQQKRRKEEEEKKKSPEVHKKSRFCEEKENRPTKGKAGNDKTKTEKKKQGKKEEKTKVNGILAGGRVQTISHANVSDSKHPKWYRRFNIALIFPQKKVDEQPEKEKAELQKKRNEPVNKQRPINLSDLVTAEILEQWYFCQINFLLPCLVLLSNPLFFLIGIFFYSFLGVVIAFHKRKTRINSFILSLYPFFFHVCFLVLYWVKSEKVLALTQLICLVVFLLGSVHHCLTLIYEILAFGFKLVRQMCKNKKIEPKTPKKKKDKATRKDTQKVEKEKKQRENTNHLNKKKKVKKERSAKKKDNLRVQFQDKI